MHVLVTIIDVLTDLSILAGVLLCFALLVAMIRSLLHPRSGRDESADR